MPKSKRSPYEVWPEDDCYALGYWPQSTPEELDKLGSLVATWRRKTDDLKWVDAEAWFLNHAYLAGNPHARWTWTPEAPEQFGTLDPALASDSEGQFLLSMTHVNHLIPAVKENVALLTDVDFRPEVEPASGSIADEDTAEVASNVFEILWERMGLSSKQRDAAETMCLLPAYIETCFEDTHEIIEVPEVKMRTEKEKNPITGEPLQVPVETGRTVQVPMKDLVAKVWNGYHVSVDPKATHEIGSEAWIMRSTHESLPYIREMYNKDEEGYFPENLEKLNTAEKGDYLTSPLFHYERVRQLPTQTDFQDVYNTPVEYTLKGQVILTKVDVAPTSAYPRGRTIVVANNVVLYAGDARAYHQDYPTRWHTYVPFRFWRFEDKHAGMALVDQLVLPQKKINAIDTLIQLNREHGTLQGFFIHAASEVNEDDLDGIAPRVSYRGTPPSVIQRTPVPVEYFKEKEDLIEFIRSLSRSAALMDMGSNVRANSMLETQRRQTLQSRSSTILDFQASLEKLAENILIDVSLFVRPNEDQSMLTFADYISRALSRRHALGKIEAFSGEDLRDNVRVKLDLAAAIYDTPEARKHRAIEWLQYAGATQGVDPRDKYKVAKDMGLRGYGPEDQHQLRLVKRFVKNIVDGEFNKALILPVEFHDPMIFSIHLRDIIADTNSFINYPPEVQDQIRRAWEDYFAKWQELLALQQQQMQQAQAQAAQAQEPEPAT